MESMGMANWFGELMSSYAGMVKHEGEVHDAEELNPNINFAEFDKLELMLVETGVPYGGRLH